MKEMPETRLATRNRTPRYKGTIKIRRDALESLITRSAGSSTIAIEFSTTHLPRVEIKIESSE